MSTAVEPLASAPSASAEAPSPFAADWRAVRALVRRDLLRLLRDRARLGGALAQPLLFWVVLGSGLAPTFRLAGSPELGYQRYFYPGVVLMVVLFGAIFSTIAVIEDRHQGFLQGVLVSGASRRAVVLGRCAGASAVVLLQALGFLLLLPAAGFSVGSVLWAPLLGALVLATVGLCALGFAVAWKLDSSAGYHAVMNVLLLPLWILSGALFPAPEGSAMRWILRCNPLAHAASLVRSSLHGGALPAGTGLPEVPVAAQWGVLAGGCALALWLALRVARGPDLTPPAPLSRGGEGGGEAERFEASSPSAPRPNSPLSLSGEGGRGGEVP